MKKRFFASVAALTAALCLLSACGQAEESPKVMRKDESLSSAANDEASSSEEDKDSSLLSPLLKDTSSTAPDEAVVNPEVEKAVEERTPEYYSLQGYYSFTVNGFDMVYSNEELANCFDKLQQICNESYFPMGFCYKNIETGASIGYNQYNTFMTCSTIKAPYVKSLLTKDIDLDTVIPLNEKWPGDDGTLCTMDYGTEYTAKELIEYTIIESDNTAYQLLCRNFGTDTFNSRQYELGSNFTLGYNGEWIFTYCTPEDMAKDYIDIYEFAEENENGKWLIDLMCNAKLNIQIGKALGSKYRVAQKYGTDCLESAFSDCAIVYADSPFVLCIYTVQTPETEESCQVFKDIALVCDDINSLIASEPVSEENEHEADNETQPENNA
ncbi:serine hydrolase [Ruminococcus sp.]|uniref:serine hydrolase n=1 Tax=Ruminococcus sp. TaxID=41978 RepID=UPI0025FC25D2|nr:serine hydrolase [Ruminococcus sp.]MBQ8965921.1 serine hydrolase [Ruminococcus sp.]